jgi:hypothetical protein
MPKQKQGGGGTRKYGRWKVSAFGKRYGQIWMRRKRNKIGRHVLKNPNDAQSIMAKGRYAHVPL